MICVKDRDWIDRGNPAYLLWLVCVGLGVLAVLVLALDAWTPFRLESFTWPCSIYRVTGLYCGGCGGTRAVFALLEGKILLSLHYHPLILYLAVLYLLFLVRGLLAFFSRGRYPYMKFRLAYVYIGVGITLVQLIVKNYFLLRYGVHLL